LHDIPALAVSRDIHSDLSFDEVAKVAAKYFNDEFERGEIFFNNINFPIKYRTGKPEFKFSRLGKRDYKNAFVRKTENGRTFFEIHGEIYDIDKSEGTDIFAVENGYISVTPLHFDVTHHEKIS
jgi:5'-nucleotidase